nr:acyltransferase [Paracoccus sp. PAR01]
MSTCFQCPKVCSVLGNIQILRFAAATLVVLFHVAWTAQNEGRSTSFLAHFIKWGESGVDIFFVISGFVMVLSQARTRRSLGQFLLERAIRIVPMYWILTLLLTGLLLALPQLFSNSSFSASKTLTSLFFVNWLSGEGFPVVYVGWTLEYEWLFYIFFAFSFSLLPLELTWIPVLASFSLLSASGWIEWVSVEFVYGMGIGLFYLRGWKLPFPSLFIIIGMAMLIGAALFQVAELPRPVAYGVPAVLIVAGLVYLPQLRGRAVMFLGAASYSIYLIQVFTIPVAFRVIQKFVALPSDVVALLAAAITLLAGGLACSLVEKPLGRRLHRLHRPEPQMEIGVRS